MKIVIDIDDKYYDEIMNMDHFKRSYAEAIIYDGIPLPKNHTNGDMIKTLFPNAKIIPNGGLMRFCVKNGVYTFHTEWWNATYKAESEDEG